MLKNRKRKIAVALTAAMLLGSVCAGNAGAASNSIGGSCGGHSTYGSVSVGKTSATATTSCGTFASLYAYVEYVTWFGSKNYIDTKTAQGSGYGITATAQKSMGGAEPKYAKSTHRVAFGAYNWTPDPITATY